MESMSPEVRRLIFGRSYECGGYGVELRLDEILFGSPEDARRAFGDFVDQLLAMLGARSRRRCRCGC